MTIKRRNKVGYLVLLACKGGPMEVKAGAKIKRAKQVKVDRKEIRIQLEDF